MCLNDVLSRLNSNSLFFFRCFHGSRPRASQRAIDKVHNKLPLIPPKGGSKSEFVVFAYKIQLKSNKVCYNDFVFKLKAALL